MWGNIRPTRWFIHEEILRREFRLITFTVGIFCTLYSLFFICCWPIPKYWFNIEIKLIKCYKSVNLKLNLEYHLECKHRQYAWHSSGVYSAKAVLPLVKEVLECESVCACMYVCVCVFLRCVGGTIEGLFEAWTSVGNKLKSPLLLWSDAPLLLTKIHICPYGTYLVQQSETLEHIELDLLTFNCNFGSLLYVSICY